MSFQKQMQVVLSFARGGGRVVSASESETIVPSSTTASAIIYDARTCTWRWSSGLRVWLENERFEFDAY